MSNPIGFGSPGSGGQLRKISQGVSTNVACLIIIDTATFENPHEYPVGIAYVIVDGAVTVEDD